MSEPVSGGPILDLWDVSTMKQVRARAEFLAWTTRDAYQGAAKNAPGVTAHARIAMLGTAQQYKRRAIRISNYCNSRG